jgi:outer membrane protein assembly factor BamB
VKLDEEGRLRWARQFLGEGFYLPREVVTDGVGNIALAGVYNGSVDFGQGPVSAQGDTAFLARFSPDGSPRWSRTFPEPLGSEDPGLAVDDGGDLYLSATRVTQWTADGSYYGDPFLVRLSPRGDVLWTRRIEGAVGLVQQVAVQGQRVVVTGYFQAPFTFAGQTVAPEGRDAFLVAYSARGEERWARGFGFWGHAVDFTPQGEVVLAGEYANGDTLDGVPLTASPGEYDRPFFVASFEGQDGRLRWVRSVPSQFSRVWDVSVGRHGESTVVGSFQGPTDFGKGPVSSEGEGGAFIFRLAR